AGRRSVPAPSPSARPRPGSPSPAPWHHSSRFIVRQGAVIFYCRFTKAALINFATAVFPAVVRCGPPPLNAAQFGASNFGATKTKFGNFVAAAARAASSSGGITMVSSVAGGGGERMFPGPRMTVMRAIRFKAEYFALKLLIAAVIFASHSGCVTQQAGAQLSTVRTTWSGFVDPFAHGDSIISLQKSLFGLAHSVMYPCSRALSCQRASTMPGFC